MESKTTVQHRPWTGFYNGAFQSQVSQPAFENALTCTGSVKGNFHSPNPFKFDKVLRVYPHGSDITEFNDGKEIYLYEGFTQSYGMPEYYVRDFAAAYEAALEKLYDKIYGNTNLTVDAAETPHTAHQVGKLLPKLHPSKLSGLGRYLRGSRKAILVADSYLAYKYMLKPMIDTVGSILKLSDDIYSQRKITVRASRSRIDGPIEYVRPDNVGNPGCTYSSTGNYRVEIGVTYAIDDPDEYLKKVLYSLNPARIAWELTPWSFVVDWFVNVAGFLKVLENSYGTGLAFKTGYVTYSYREVTDGRWHQARKLVDYDGRTRITDLKYQVTRTGLDRRSLPFFPRPNLPGFKVNLGASQVASAAALLTQLFYRR